MKLKLSKEMRVGLLALAAGTVLFIGFNFLKGSELFSSTKKYHVLYNNVDGLTPSNPVVLNGLAIGRVDKIKLMPEKNNRVLVTLDVNDDILLGDSTYAKLASTDLLGGKAIELTLGKNSKNYDNEDTLIGVKDQPISEMIAQKAMPILTNLDSTVVKLNAIFGDELGISIKNILHNFEIASNDMKLTMAHSRGNIEGITTNINSLTASLKETERSVKPLLTKLNQFADTLNDLQLKQTINNANTAMKNLNAITTKIEQGKGSIGALINDKALYDNLNTSAKDLDKLFVDIQKNPKRYVHFSVFGGNGGKDKDAKNAPTPNTATPTTPAPAKP
ncbi:MAG TPA: MlaD family protein [Cytophagaceae bacterium]